MTTLKIGGRWVNESTLIQGSLVLPEVILYKLHVNCDKSAIL